ncbi:MAG TPA: ornithine cyclodeaminase family protein [Longimicrobiales bacterium]|nr:ornithine cyclodeaminase family protein [Longimicrobiales bacterium]
MRTGGERRGSVRPGGPTPSATLLYLSRRDVESLEIPMSDVIAAVEGAFRERANGTAEMPPKPGVHPLPDAFIHAMPAFLGGMGAAGMKWVSGFPTNQARGLPYISGLFILNDVGTGFPLAVMDATWITGARTGAATAVAARHLARPDSSTVGIVACGVQGRTNLEALATLFPLARVHAYDIVHERARAYAAEMGPPLGLEVVPVATPEEALRGMDLVVTSGPILKHPDPIIPAGWLAPGAFATALDFDSYWSPEALAEADLLATDDHAQLEYYRSIGYFARTPEPYADLGELVTGQKAGRASDEQRTMSINLGLAVEDVATGRLVYERALAAGVGVELAL